MGVFTLRSAAPAAPQAPAMPFSSPNPRRGAQLRYAPGSASTLHPFFTLLNQPVLVWQGIVIRPSLSEGTSCV